MATIPYKILQTVSWWIVFKDKIIMIYPPLWIIRWQVKLVINREYKKLVIKVDFRWNIQKMEKAIYIKLKNCKF